MALKIKKQIKNSDGTITELEGTEAEIEAFLKKESKKQESVQKKKSLILGKGMEARIREIIAEELAKLPAAQTSTYHHWYHYNGWWWRPYYTLGGSWLYQYTNSNPTNYTANSLSCSENTGVMTCQSAQELSKMVGVPEHQATLSVSSMSSQLGSQLLGDTRLFATNSAGDSLASSTFSCSDDSKGTWVSALNANAGGEVGQYTSGIINMNIKS